MSAFSITPFHPMLTWAGPVDVTRPYQICMIWPSPASKNGELTGDHELAPPPETDVTASGHVSLMTTNTSRSPSAAG
jgi:hypothetical protein